MRKTNQNNAKAIKTLNPLSVDTNGLQAILGCGRTTAVEIGTNAEAKIIVGKRLLWNVSKVQEYLNSIATE